MGGNTIWVCSCQKFKQAFTVDPHHVGSTLGTVKGVLLILRLLDHVYKTPPAMQKPLILICDASIYC